MDTADSRVVKQFEVPVANPDKVHPQFRHARLTPAGTLLVAHLDSGRVVEYDADGKALWSVGDLPGAWSAQRLANGNTLISLQMPSKSCKKIACQAPQYLRNPIRLYIFAVKLFRWNISPCAKTHMIMKIKGIIDRVGEGVAPPAS